MVLSSELPESFTYISIRPERIFDVRPRTAVVDAKSEQFGLRWIERKTRVWKASSKRASEHAHGFWELFDL